MLQGSVACYTNSMAFGETKRQLAALQAEVDEYHGLGVYVDLAKELQARVTERLSRITETDLNAAFSQSVSDVEDELVQKGIAAKLAALPTERVLGMYAARFGDESVNQPLKELAELRRQEAERQVRFERIKQEATVSRRLDFRHIDEGEIVTVGLFRSELFKASHQTFTNRGHAGRVIELRIQDGASGAMEVLGDEISSMEYYKSRTPGANTPFEDHAIIRVGTVIKDTFQPVVTQGTSCAIETDRSWYNLRGYDLGYVALGKTSLL